MGDRASNASKVWSRAASAAAFFAILLALTLVLAAGVRAQETDGDQTDEATTSEETTLETTTEQPTAQAEETPTAPKSQEQPAAEDGETNTSAGEVPATGEEDPVAQAQSSSDETEQDVQESGQQAQARVQDDTEDESSTQTTSRTTPRGRSATLFNFGGDRGVDRIVVQISSCEIDDDAYIVIKPSYDARRSFRFNENGNANIEATDDQLIVNVERNVPNGFGPDGRRGNGEVVGSSGISCGRDNGGNGGKANNDLDDLGCGELLRRFRDAGRQYGELEIFADIDIRNQIIICLEQEVVQDTAADEDLPDTGGPSLIGFAALGIASAVAGASLIRGRRED